MESDAAAAEGIASLTGVLQQFHRGQLDAAARLQTVDRGTPRRVGEHIGWAVGTCIDVAVGEMTRRLAERHSIPKLSDGSTPRLTVIAVDRAAAMEFSYSTPVPSMFIVDNMEHRDRRHRRFYETLVRDVVRVLSGGIDVDLRPSPRFEVGTPVCSFFDAVRIFETGGGIRQRMQMSSARVIAGSHSLGDAVIQRLTPWVYRRFQSSGDAAEWQMWLGEGAPAENLAAKGAASHSGSIQHRSAADQSPDQTGLTMIDPETVDGGMRSIRQTVGMLKLLHGGTTPTVRQTGTLDAIDALRDGGFIPGDDASKLQQNYVRLWRLEQEMWLANSIRQSPTSTQDDAKPDAIKHGKLAGDPGDQVAIRLGVTNAAGEPDTPRLNRRMKSLLDENRRMAASMWEAGDIGHGGDPLASLILDPSPGSEAAAQALSAYGIRDVVSAAADLRRLSTETVRFLSSHRCRHMFSVIAEPLLAEIARTPAPDRTLQSLVAVTDSLGAKAGLWELVAANRPTLRLLVRLCAAAKYLVDILVANPGMFDELVDSLLIDRLPTAGQLESHSQDLVRGAEQVDLILRGFRNSSHLIIGVRDLLGVDPFADTLGAIADVADAMIRRVADDEYATLTDAFGDPHDDDGVPVPWTLIVWDKHATGNPNYHSDLRFTVVYAADGETKRRIGGRRTTASNADLFETLAVRIGTRLSAGGSMPLMPARHWTPTASPDVAITTDALLASIVEPSLPLPKRLRLTRRRFVVGNRVDVTLIDDQIRAALASTPPPPDWRRQMRTERAAELRDADPMNLKRSRGGTIEAERLAAASVMAEAGGDGDRSPPTDERPADATRIGVEAAMRNQLGTSEATEVLRSEAYLRRVESYLRLMAVSDRHRYPESDPGQAADLAYLLGAATPAEVRQDIDRHQEIIHGAFRRYLDWSDRD